VNSNTQIQALAESLTLASSHPTFPTIALRSAPIFGPTDPVIIPTIHALIAAHSTPFILGNATNLQDYVYIDNIAHAHVLAVQNLLGAQTAAGHAVFVTNGQPVTVRDLCMAVWKEFGHTPRWQVTLPEGLAWGLGYVAEWGSWVAGADLGFSRGMVSDGCRERYVNIAKARRVLGYKPIVSLEEGVRRTCEAYRKKIEGRSKRGGREEIR
jgi:sterol-4alpha-carboxylate 3-dehydrogenase (decarboxylating)